MLGRKLIEQTGTWVPSLMAYGTAGTLGLLYFTDWKAVLRYVPIYGSKYPPEEESK